MDNPLLLIIIIPVSLILGLVFAGDISKTVYACPNAGHGSGLNGINTC